MKRKERKYKEKMLKQHPEEWYRCAQCEEIWKKEISDEWSDEKAKEEYKKNFPELPDVEKVLICDDCYQEIMKPERFYLDPFEMNS